MLDIKNTNSQCQNSILKETKNSITFYKSKNKTLELLLSKNFLIQICIKNVTAF